MGHDHDHTPDNRAAVDYHVRLIDLRLAYVDQLARKHVDAIPDDFRADELDNTDHAALELVAHLDDPDDVPVEPG